MALAESRARRRQVASAVLVAIGCWVLLGAAYLLGLFESFDLTLLDWRYRARGERPASDSIALVVIDDVTIRSYGRWPIPRDQYALLVTAIADAGARATGIDLQFPSDRNQDPKSDALLAYVASQQDRLVLATWFHSDTRDTAGPSEPEVLAALERQGVPAGGVSVPEAASAALPYPDLALSARQMGHITVAVDRDGAIRRQPAMVRYGDRLYASLALRMAGASRDRTTPPEARAEGTGLGVGWRGGPWWKLPLDHEGSTPIDFAGDRLSFPRSYPMVNVLRWYRDGETARLRAAFGTRLVLIGLDSRKEVTEDVSATPFAAATPLLFVHANLLDNLLRDRFLVRPPAGLYLGSLGLLAVFLGWAYAMRSLSAAALVATAATLAVAAADFVLLGAWAIDVPPMAALLLAPTSYGAVATYRYAFLTRSARTREEEIREGRSVQQQFLPEALVGQRLSHYRIVEMLGAGGMGVVYRGRDERLGRDVAVKVLRGRALADERSRRRFRTEARALSRLTHPHIAGIYDFDSQDGADFIVMECVLGQSLEARIRRGPLPEPEATAIAAQIAGALAEAHARGVVHRDLKPANVVLDDRGQVKVLDFGLARLAHGTAAATSTVTATATRSLTEEGTVMGTLPYMAPEALRGEKAGPASDLYSLGVLLFEMLTARLPFPDDEPHELMYAILNQPPPEPRSLNGRISERMETLVLRLLEKDPLRRPPGAAAVVDDLAQPPDHATRSR